MSSLSARQRRNRRRTSDRTFLAYLIGASVALVGLVALALWAADRPPAAPANAVVAQPAVAEAELLPLAEPVKPISGFHDMANLPQRGDEQPRQVAAGAPRARVDLPLARWDWGTIPAKPPVQQTFPIQNTGDESLIVSSVVTSCGCTTADLSSSVIPPGQRADLTVIFDPNYHATSGPVTRLAWLKTNDPEMPVVELRMDANVTP
jgi:hypothetical protein